MHPAELLFWSDHKLNQEINVKAYPLTLMLRLWKALWSLAFSMGLCSLAWYFLGCIKDDCTFLGVLIQIIDNCWLIGWSDTFIKGLNHKIAVSTVLPCGFMWPLELPWTSTQEHLRWMIQKDSLGQDIFLLGVCGGRGSFNKTLFPAISESRWIGWAFNAY